MKISLLFFMKMKIFFKSEYQTFVKNQKILSLTPYPFPSHFLSSPRSPSSVLFVLLLYFCFSGCCRPRTRRLARALPRGSGNKGKWTKSGWFPGCSKERMTQIISEYKKIAILNMKKYYSILSNTYNY